MWWEHCCKFHSRLEQTPAPSWEHRKVEFFAKHFDFKKWTSVIAQSVKNLPAMQETRVLFLGWEDPLEKETITHSSILAWRIPWTEEPCGLQSMGSQESDMTE